VVAVIVFAIWRRLKVDPGLGPVVGPGANPQVEPAKAGANYDQFVSAFDIGLAGLDADVPQIAEENLTKAVTLEPGEPAGWANRGLLYIRTGRLPQAEADLKKADSLLPDDLRVARLTALLKQKQGAFGEAAGLLRKVVAKEPDDVLSLYALARIVDQERKDGSEAEYQKLIEQVLEARGDNLRALSERLRVAARRNDAAAVEATLKRFDELAPNWSAQTKQMLDQLKKTLADPAKPSSVSPMLRFLNVLRAEKNFARFAQELEPNDSLQGEPIRTFQKLPPIQRSPAAPDSGLVMDVDASAKFPDGVWKSVVPVWMNAESPPVVVAANDSEVRIGGREEPLASIEVARDGVVAIDWNNDMLTDLLLLGPGGLRFFQQGEKGQFEDVTVKTGLTDDVLKDRYATGLVADLDLDADLDLVLSREKGSPLRLRNNFDGTFRSDPSFEQAEGPQRFAWVDLDHDGVPDLAMLDREGRLRVYANDRSSAFTEWPVAPPTDPIRAMAVVDADDDGGLELVGLFEGGKLWTISDQGKRAGWKLVELGQWPDIDKQDAALPIALLAEDFDNNGATDFLASGSEGSILWLATGSFRGPLASLKLPPRIVAAADLDGDGRLNPIGLDGEGRPFVLTNQGQKNYQWLTIRPKGTKAEGDNRINSFGIGGTIEVRSGSLFAKRAIQTPAVHFGLGERPKADVARIVWPNGAAQIEFDLKPNMSLVAVQRLKGSCPFLYAWTGERFEFVTDFLWSSPLGMYINASDKGGYLQTTDWVKVPGRQLVPREGRYELRVNANLWETHFIDQIGLFAVDHPEGTELFVDERFHLTPTDPSFQIVSPPRQIAQAWDHLGKDATKEVLNVDGVHLDRAGRGLYQGVTNDHWVEVDLGEQTFASGPVWLIAKGWMHPTDSSVNYALEQGKHVTPRPLVLEVPDGAGGWKTGRDKLGFLAGKNKTALIRLDDLEGGVPQRLRLRTNLEIYWDAIQVAEGGDSKLAKQQTLDPQVVDLRFGGVFAMTQTDPSCPELPHYGEMASVGQPWRDLIGYHTRFGEISELVSAVDDRYAILNAGDEIVVSYPALPAPEKGWTRDFVWIADGWVKDGDLNTHFGKTVLPLPSHDMKTYDVPPSRLEDDPVYQRFPADWETYHTRYVTPYLFEQGLRTPRREPLSADRGSR
jgi:tetratricopeptide (TPR) repeat protein